MSHDDANAHTSCNPTYVYQMFFFNTNFRGEICDAVCRLHCYQSHLIGIKCSNEILKEMNLGHFDPLMHLRVKITYLLPSSNPI